MQLQWLIRENNDELVLFVLGWAADHRIVEHIRPERCDVLAVYDYSEGIGGSACLKNLLSEYSRIHLFAWSFGVWGAERILEGVSFTTAVALNGTPYPVNEIYGIEPKRMAVTIRGIKKSGMETFNRRAYGEYFDSMSHLLAPRPLEKNIAELEYLASASVEEYTPSIGWGKGIIGSADLIFPPENMVRFWGSRSEILPLPHYPLADGGLIEKEIGNR